MENKIKVLVATDFSKQSDSAVLFASNLAKKIDVELTLVHVSDVSPVWDWPASDQQARNLLSSFQTEITESINKLVSAQQGKFNIKANSIIRFGSPQKELIELINSTQANLLIMGHRGQTGFFEVGSLAEKMIASSPVPVMIIKDDKDIKTISCLVDTSRISQDSIEWSKKFAQIYNAQDNYISFVSDLSSSALAMSGPMALTKYKFDDSEKKQIIENVKNEILTNVEGLSEDRIHVEISELPTVKALVASMNDRKTNLAVISKHNRGPIEKFFIGSISKGIIHSFKGNVLVLPA